MLISEAAVVGFSLGMSVLLSTYTDSVRHNPQWIFLTTAA
jgi:hypothetical protein